VRRSAPRQPYDNRIIALPERCPGRTPTRDPRPASADHEECSVAAKSFASSADLDDKEKVLEVLGDGVYALSGGDPNVGAVEGEAFVVALEARATPVMTRQWLDKLREHTDKPVKYLMLWHYHGVRVLDATTFDARVTAHETTRKLIVERGTEDWNSEAGGMPRGLTSPIMPAVVVPGGTRLREIARRATGSAVAMPAV
jgi:hypothetical protein